MFQAMVSGVAQRAVVCLVRRMCAEQVIHNIGVVMRA
jgi:hypothetical protein